MGDKKTIHIISHTHWDREWYLPYEKHHFLLIKLMDRLLETLENDPEYKSFHLDGQTIILEDYLQVRPDNREKLQEFIDSGRIHIGPWYILQDEFLISSEANIRNLQYGIKDARKWGSLSKIGYFPDSFGNVGQAPQILRQAGIDSAVFGRGVKPTGFNNTVVDTENFESPYSEMYWRSPDGSTVLGVLFANWYCNGNEVPVSNNDARVYWDRHLEALTKYASTPHLLMMNGCDHQPIQTDLSKAIRTAQDLYPEVTFVHSNFNDYVSSLLDTVPANLKVIEGELRSQQTDGWGTLVNTASSRNYLKQMNRECETLLEKVAEPLATFAYMHGEEYPHHMFEYTWKTLMQNHPHDSICGCSVDEVHREMVTRFEKSKHTTEMLIDESLSSISEKINTVNFSKYGESSIPFTVFNTTGWSRTGTVSITLDVKRQYFATGVNKRELKAELLDNRILVDEDGNEYSFEMKDLGIMFGYDLPEEKFRQPYMARRIQLEFEAEAIPALGFKTFAFVVGTEQPKTSPLSVNEEKHEMENEYLSVKIKPNGSVTLIDKTTGVTFPDLCVYENSGDIGNEYMYRCPTGEEKLTTKNVTANISLIENSSFRVSYEIIHEWEIPKQASDLLDKEQRELVWFTARKAIRSKETIPFKLKTVISLEKSSKGLSVKTTFDNQAKDHRLRVLLPTNISTNVHHADSIFEISERPNEPDQEWNNPDNSQHQQAFVGVSNDKCGLLIANKGLYEYEILRDGKNTIALTLLRSVGELGDWGYFPTPEAQCLGEHTVSFRIYPHGGDSSKYDAYKDAYQYQVPWTSKQTAIRDGNLPSTYSFFKWEGSNLVFSSLKVAEQSEDIMVRLYNTAPVHSNLNLHIPPNMGNVYLSNVIETRNNLLEKDENSRIEVQVDKYQITTIAIEKSK